MRNASPSVADRTAGLGILVLLVGGRGVETAVTTARFACLALVVAAAVLAGCGNPLSGPGFSDENATERALAAEEAFVSERLSNATCVDEWGTEAIVVEREAVVTDRGAEALSVNVTQPYWYGTAEDSVDGGSRARYRVTANAIERVGGDAVSPC